MGDFSPASSWGISDIGFMMFWWWCFLNRWTKWGDFTQKSNFDIETTGPKSYHTCRIGYEIWNEIWLVWWLNELIYDGFSQQGEWLTSVWIELSCADWTVSQNNDQYLVSLEYHILSHYLIQWSSACVMAPFRTLKSIAGLLLANGWIFPPKNVAISWGT